jgi:hypothetical protein
MFVPEEKITDEALTELVGSRPVQLEEVKIILQRKISQYTDSINSATNDGAITDDGHTTDSCA